MKKIKISVVDEFYYTETLSNGLKICMFPNYKVSKTYATLTTNFGSIHDEFKLINQEQYIKVPSGIAHFLEHQMFENKADKDIVSLFEKNNATPNAYTTDNHTSYLFKATSNICENINLLLDLVFDLNISKQSVEKEKGIIIQELNMNKDVPFAVLNETILKTLFVNDKRKIPVIGTKDDINITIKENLEDCYKTFYHPSNMFLIVTGNFDPKTIIKTVKENMEKRKFEKRKKPDIKKISEPQKIAIKNIDKKLNVENSKLSYNIKIKLKNQKQLFEQRMYYYILIKSLFGSISILNEQLKQKELINTDLMFDIDKADKYLIFTIVCETKNKQQVVDLIDKQLNDIKIKEEEFESVKKSIYSSYLRMLENITALNHNTIYQIIDYKKFDKDFLIKIKNLKYDELKDIVSKTNFKNRSIVYIHK